jgi:hypothetical protein
MPADEPEVEAMQPCSSKKSPENYITSTPRVWRWAEKKDVCCIDREMIPSTMDGGTYLYPRQPSRSRQTKLAKEEMSRQANIKIHGL